MDWEHPMVKVVMLVMIIKVMMIRVSVDALHLVAVVVVVVSTVLINTIVAILVAIVTTIVVVVDVGSIVCSKAWVKKVRHTKQFLGSQTNETTTRRRMPHAAVPTAAAVAIVVVIVVVVGAVSRGPTTHRRIRIDLPPLPFHTVSYTTLHYTTPLEYRVNPRQNPLPSLLLFAESTIK